MDSERANKSNTYGPVNLSPTPVSARTGVPIEDAEDVIDAAIAYVWHKTAENHRRLCAAVELFLQEMRKRGGALDGQEMGK